MLSIVFEFLEHYPYGQHQHLKQLCEPFFSNSCSDPILSRRPLEAAQSNGAHHLSGDLKRNGLALADPQRRAPLDDFCAYRLRQYQQQIARQLPNWLAACSSWRR